MASRTDLATVIENRGTLLEQCLERVHGGETGGGLFFEIAFHHRLLGIAHLLLHGDTAAFARHLQHSGHARLHWLRTNRGTPDTDTEFRSRANDVGWDAFAAAGDLEHARSTAALLPDHCFVGDEYEEDFLWKRLLHTLLAHEPDAAVAAAQPHLTALRAVESDTVGRKIAVAAALVQRSQEQWAQSFAAFVDARRTRFAELASTPGFSREHLATERHVFVGGLAIERVAAHLGLQPIDLPTLPAAARVPIDGPRVDGTAWMRLPAS